MAPNPPGAALIDAIHAREQERSRFVRWFCRIFRVELVEPSWRTGLVGEQAVGDALARLPEPSWHVIHGLTWPSGADTDHLVMGPSGVFCINTKHHPGQRIWAAKDSVKVGNHTKDYIRDAGWEADRVAKVLKVWCGWDVPVRPMVAFIDAERITVAAAHDRVIVADGRELDKTLAAFPSTLTPGRVEQVFHVARRRSVWASAPRGQRR